MAPQGNSSQVLTAEHKQSTTESVSENKPRYPRRQSGIMSFAYPCCFFIFLFSSLYFGTISRCQNKPISYVVVEGLSVFSLVVLFMFVILYGTSCTMFGSCITQHQLVASVV